MVEDHRKNSYQNKMNLHAMSAKAEDCCGISILGIAEMSIFTVCICLAMGC